MPFIPNTSRQEEEILKALGVSSFEDLLNEIPSRLLFHGDLNLPAPLSELEALKLLRELAGKNKTIWNYACFLGGGAYDHFVPSVVDTILSRSEFYTAYTPYQPEVSQGTLQAAFEYQTMICELTGMEVTNASMYDGGSALAEAVLMAHGQKRIDRVLVSEGVNPNYRQIIQTYCHGQQIAVEPIRLTNSGQTDLDHLKTLLEQPACAVVLQHPNFFGALEEVFEAEQLIHSANALYITSVDPISLGILAPPGDYKADIVTGEGQVLGNALSYGGPYLGIFSVRKEWVRRMPGRLIGETVDAKGRRGFVMTLQTREQHIRRERATSNICTNQALNALAATVYLSWLGKKGIREVAEQCLQKSHYLANHIADVPGFSLHFKAPFFKEFTVECPVPAANVIQKLKEKRIFAGLDLGRYNPEWKNLLLVAVTEKRTRQEMDEYVKALGEL